jgi:hypothetical protein
MMEGWGLENPRDGGRDRGVTLNWKIGRLAVRYGMARRKKHGVQERRYGPMLRSPMQMGGILVSVE